jgi:superfamily I DNA/RNA helicase
VQAEIIFLLSGSGAASRRWYDRPLVPGHLFMVGDPKQAIYRFRGADIATYWQAREAIERQTTWSEFPRTSDREAQFFNISTIVSGHRSKRRKPDMSSWKQRGTMRSMGFRASPRSRSISFRSRGWMISAMRKRGSSLKPAQG